MVLSKKSKCAGCAALVEKPEGYECYLKFSMSFQGTGASKHAPTPEEKCYKPTDKVELANAKQRKEKLDNRE